MENFLGKDNFIWWVGIVEDRMDPLGLGRCRVRIFGWYDDGTPEAKINMPVEKLPWATAMLPINSSRSFNVPELNDWVMGFFMDGQAGQFPVMMGVLPGFSSPPSAIESAPTLS